MNEFNDESKRWICLLNVVTYHYNIAVYSATNKTPFKLFNKRKEYNTVLKAFDKTENQLFEDQKYDDNIQNGLNNNKFMDDLKTNCNNQINDEKNATKNT